MRAALLAALLLVSCGPELTREQQAIQVAHEHAREQFRYYDDIRELPPRVVDLGDRWRVEFQIPPEMAGGAPQIEVRKSDLAVVSSITGQ